MRPDDGAHVTLLSLAIASALESGDFDEARVLLDARGEEIDRLRSANVRLSDAVRARLAGIDARINAQLTFGRDRIASEIVALGRSRRVAGKYRSSPSRQYESVG